MIWAVLPELDRQPHKVKICDRGQYGRHAPGGLAGSSGDLDASGSRAGSDIGVELSTRDIILL